VQETELECGVGLSLGFILCLGDVHELAEMVNGHLDVAALGMDIGKELMCLSFLISRASLELSLADLEEPVKTADGLFKVPLLLMDETNPLIALGLLFFHISTLARLEALLEEAKRAIKLVSLLEVDSNDLVHSHKLL
jgi:hypothetical protein